MELSHVDYLKRLMKLTSKVAEDVQKEAKSFELELLDIHSYS